MSFLLLLVHQVIYVLQPFDWPSIAYIPAIPITVLILLASSGFLFLENKLNIISTQMVLLAGFCIVILMSGLFNGWLGGGYQQLEIFIFSAVLPFLLYSNLMVSITRQEFVGLVFLLYSLIMLSNGLSQFNSPEGIGWAGAQISQGTRITYLGIVNDPNDLAGYFLMCLPFALYFAWFKKNIIVKAFGLFCAASIVFGIYLTNSRGGLLSGLFIALVYFFLHYGTFKTAILGVFLSPVALFAFSRFRAIELESSAVGRTDAWYEGLQLLESNPLFGIGMGNFADEVGIVAHNSFVHIMAELGIIGYGIWFSTITLSVYMTFHIMMKFRKIGTNGMQRSDAQALSRAVALNNTIFYSILGYMATAFFLSRGYSFFTYIVCAFAVASYYRVVAIDQEYALIDIKSKLKSFAGYSFASIIFMYVTTNIVALVM